VKKIGSGVSDFFQIGAGVQTEVRAAQNSSNLKPHWSSAQALSSAPLGRGSLVLAACAFQLVFLKRWALRKPTRSASPLISLLQSIRLNRRSLLLLQSHHTPRVFLAPQRPPRKGTGPGAALPDAFIEPFLATWGSIG
jgi:hypothetical protein